MTSTTALIESPDPHDFDELLVRRLREHPLPHFFLPGPHAGEVKVRRV